ncbi:hypothetical protein MATL_G00047920 [Megalops atlanticus]|uniref:Uncharacterized protein n=1 Tax=Megalops atlanticus TaxID=7932 RepID=A0A9D3TIR1_MEGAT|nr:hypothetical protein MATL_G00047920 [Megalops atlanticus]
MRLCSYRKRSQLRDCGQRSMWENAEALFSIRHRLISRDEGPVTLFSALSSSLLMDRTLPQMRRQLA